MIEISLNDLTDDDLAIQIRKMVLTDALKKVVAKPECDPIDLLKTALGTAFHDHGSERGFEMVIPDDILEPVFPMIVEFMAATKMDGPAFNRIKQIAQYVAGRLGLTVGDEFDRFPAVS